MSDQDLWDLADSLGVLLEVEDGQLVCTRSQKEIVFGSLKLSVPLQIISSALTKDGAVALARSLGNVALLSVTRYKDGSPISIFIVDVAKMKGRPEGFIERMNPVRPQEVVDEFERQGAIVGIFHKSQQNVWHEQHKVA